jgi:hypothetical protein
LPSADEPKPDSFTAITEAGVADDDAGLAALGVAWAEMIGRGQRAADHYSWRLALGTALDGLAALPASP